VRKLTNQRADTPLAELYRYADIGWNARTPSRPAVPAAKKLLPELRFTRKQTA